MAVTSSATELLADPLLRDVPVVQGLKVIAGVALYAKVGQGGMGVVYRGRHCLLDVDMAVKVLKPSLIAEDERFALRFRREAQVAAHITHQNVIRLYECNQQHGLHYLLMEFVDGESARGRVQRKGPLAEAEALGILLGAAAGLAEAHRAGVVHRDVKPDNLLVSRDGRVKVADLGLVRREGAGNDSLSLGSGIMGTPQYMAPEQWDSPDVTAAADVWALGAVLWYLLVGEHAISITTLAAAARRVQEQDFPSLRERRADLRPEVHALLARCTARRPADRFADARELVEALLPLVSGGEERLRDPEAGLGGSRPVLPTPPSRELIAAIRDAIGTGTQVAGTDRQRREAETILSAGGTARLPEPGARPRVRRPWRAIAVALVAAVSVGWFGLEQGWFVDPDWEATEKIVRARGLWEEAQRLATQPDGFDPAIEKLEEVVYLQPEFAAARRKLAEWCGERAERALATDGWSQPNAERAVADAQRASELLPGEAKFTALRTRAEQNLAAAVSVTVGVEQPAPDAVVDGAGFVVEGSLGWRDVPAVTIVVDGMPAVRASVLDGRFRATVAAPPGPGRLRIGYELKQGVASAALPQSFFAAGCAAPPAWLADPAAHPQPVVHNLAGITMRPVPARTFTMGAPEDEADADDLRIRPVEMTMPFWLGTTEVTRRQWMRVMNTSPWAEEHDPAPTDNPAIDVTWKMASDFCAALTELERAAGRVPEGWRYVLPSEAQWELAARGGDQRRFPHGDDAESLATCAVFGEPVDFPHAVGTRVANPFGLFDLGGNVAEWCADIVPEGSALSLLTIGRRIEPLSVLGTHRVHRGGHHGSPAADCRCAARVVVTPEVASSEIGFRTALAKR